MSYGGEREADRLRRVHTGMIDDIPDWGEDHGARDDDRPIILDAQCDQCGRFVKVVEVWQGAGLGVTRVVATCRVHGKHDLPAHCYAVFWPGE